ncbi:AGAP002973-PA-like protein [Anopheles sinensis]|uniref:AGAP002973-PA-like protein n=1 Tax=Anopheles sinensis TaxID=74873 RepID=A0A084VZB5_ANOSI|nr:AGAP002973-PA-like protein [Anopheles sinensis]
MQPSFKVLVCVVFVCMVGAARGEAETDANAHLERAKRWLNFPVNGGVAKMVLGIVVPIRFFHPLPRIIVNTYNLQANYRIPADIIFPRPESVFKNRALATQEAAGLKVPASGDRSRKQLYEMLERGWSQWGHDGHACLLRAVCEVAETPLKHNGLIGEIIDVIFTPSPTDGLDAEYHLAQVHGLRRLNCFQLYPKCPGGHGFFDRISTLALS